MADALDAAHDDSRPMRVAVDQVPVCAGRGTAAIRRSAYAQAAAAGVAWITRGSGDRDERPRDCGRRLTRPLQANPADLRESRGK